MQTMNTQPAAGAQPTPGAAPAGASASLPQQALTPDQIHKMQIMARQAMMFLTKGTTADHILAQCKAGNPAQVIATTVVAILHRVWESAQAAGQQVDMVTVLVTGLQIIGDLTEMLIGAGVVSKDQAPQFIAQASQLAVQKHNAMVGSMGAPGAAPPGAAGAPPQAQPQPPMQGGA